ncbi:MAG TPA: PepSY-associated TM helix domain-containing protein [Micropepsaceae bacterium]|nr:PepSY-associated TM helix domain-containing protein [Micropepsaceae bacterium]
MSDTIPGTVPAASARSAPLAWSRPHFKQMVRTLHLWAGIVLCLPMILIGLSGSALLVQREILWLSAPAVATGERQSFVRIVAAAEAAEPGFRANWLELPQSQRAPAGVQFIVATRPTRTVEVVVDPVSLKVLGSSELVRRGPIMAFLTWIHEFLMMPDRIGLPAVGWTAVAMTFMGLSGIILWWPRKGRWLAAFLVKRGATGLRFHLDLHHAAGIWGLLFFLVLSISGIYLAFPQTVSSAMQTAFANSQSDATPLPLGFPKAWPITPDEGISLAQAAMPGTRAAGVFLPRSADAPMIVQLETTGFSPSVPPITVAFDPRNAGSVHIDDPRHYPLPDRILNLLYALHFSVGVGPFWTFLVFLTGLMPLLLAITGLTIWWTKRSRRRAAASLRS